MKQRHVIMIITFILFIIFITTLKETKNIQNLTCTTTGKMYEMDSKTTLKVKLKDNTIKNMNLTIDLIVPKEDPTYKKNLLNYFKSEGKMQVTSTDEGIRFKMGMQDEYFKTLGLNEKSSYQDLKEALNIQGYTCK